MRYSTFTGLAGCLVLVAGCATTPKLPIAPSPGKPGKAAEYVNRIVCEIANAEPANLAFLQQHNYAVAATITIKAEDLTALTPSLSFIDPLRTPATSYTTLVAGELSRARLRTFTKAFSISAKEIKACTLPSAAAVAGDALDLGIRPVIAAGLETNKTQGVNPADEKAVKASLPSFGSTVQFADKRAVSGGPGWIRTRFKGPGGSAGLANTSRTDTNTLVIAFAPPAPAKPAAASGLLIEQLDPGMEARTDADSARAAATNLMTTLILQNLTLSNQ